MKQAFATKVAVLLALCLVGQSGAQLLGLNCATGLIKVCTGLLNNLCVCVLASGGSTGDPILTGFDGRTFEFVGEPDQFYNLYSDQHHQVNMKLFPGFVDNHNGTYIRGIGFQFHDHKLEVVLLENGDITVGIDEEQQVVDREAQQTYKMIDQIKGSALILTSEPHRIHLGRAVDIKTGTLDMTIWATAPGVMDKYNVSQPAYLNFNMTLTAAPAGDDAQGIIGETLTTYAKKAHIVDLFAESNGYPTESDADDFHFHGQGPEEEYVVSGYFATDFKRNIFGTKATGGRARQMMASRFANVVFPLSSSGLRAKWS